MPGPQVTIDLTKIEHNARSVVETCRRAGISVFGVTKGTCGMPQVARAMLRGGVVGIGESRFENIRRLRESGIDCPIMLLRSPPLSRVEEVIASVDISLNSELTTIAELSRVAERMSRVHDIIVMIDLGDLREGIWPRDLVPTIEKVLDLNGVRIAGIGTNLTCFGAVLPTTENMSELAAQAEEVERRFRLRLDYVSGGNSSSLPLLLSGGLPAGITNLRIGEAILQGGRETFLDEPWAELKRDAFLISGELLEVKFKPSKPIGRTGIDAFGRRPQFEDRGERLRGIVNIGREDVLVEGLEPTRTGVVVLGASSDHLVLDVNDAEPPPAVGDILSFRMSYGALLAAMTSEYVEKQPLLDGPAGTKSSRIQVFVESDLLELVRRSEVEARLAALGFAVESAPLKHEAAEHVAAAIRSGAVPLLVAHHHRAGLAGLRALADSTDAFGLLWIDATAGLIPPSSEGKADPASSVLYRALGYDKAHPSVLPQLSPETVAIIGLREASPHEAELLKSSRIAVHTIEDIDAVGIREAMRQALRTVSAGTRGFYVSYSPAATDIPGTLTGGGGITIRETHQAMESIAQHGGLLAMDVVGLSPHTEPRIAAETFHFVLSCFGKRIL